MKHYLYGVASGVALWWVAAIALDRFVGGAIERSRRGPIAVPEHHGRPHVSHS
jgi:hypothetical protein